ncbi:hypothetical protein AB1Y20_014100 [Prymnesium parvum]|uniref:MPN domain-containing protein n=1 Tax=Prymnesium parvum TaxID=97485 RepID=A0AB34IIC3_PRYPA
MAVLALSHDAYCVLFLHACKHPSKAVNGLLIGTVTDGAVRVTKALPLFHSSLALAPMLETALMLADELCKQTGSQLVGYYQANELANDLELGPFGKRIAEKIRSRCPEAAALLLDGSSMHPTIDDLRLVALGADGKKGSAAQPTLENAEERAAKTLAKLSEYISLSLHHELVDFDAHLDDISKDWLNTALL